MQCDLSKILKNAKSWLDKGVKYQMGADRKKLMDCSAFVWRCMEERKYNGIVWRNTDWLVSERSLPYFKRIKKPVVGCIAVYGRYRNKKGKKRAGHVCIVVDPIKKTVIDCSSSQEGVSQRVAKFFWTRKDVVYLVPIPASVKK